VKDRQGGQEVFQRVRSLQQEKGKPPEEEAWVAEGDAGTTLQIL